MTPEEIAQAMSSNDDRRGSIAQRSRMRGLVHREQRLHHTIGGVLGFTAVVVGIFAVSALTGGVASWKIQLGSSAMFLMFVGAGLHLWSARQAQLWILATPMALIAIASVLFTGISTTTLINGAGLAAVGFLGQVRGQIAD
jgi:hypothetical protein